MSEAVERELLLRCRAGDHSAYEPIVRALEPRVFAFAMGMLGNEEDARDLAQDAFIRAYQQLDRFDADRPFSAWLIGICRHLCLDHLRRKRPTVRIDEPGGGGITEPVDHKARTDRRAELGELRNLIRRGLLRLEPEQREVIVLKDIEGLPYQEIARVLGIPPGTVASRVYYARRALRGVLEQMGVCYP